MPFSVAAVVVSDIPSCPPPPRPVFVRDGYIPHLGKQEGKYLSFSIVVDFF